MIRPLGVKEKKRNSEAFQLRRQNHLNSMKLRQFLWFLETSVAQIGHKSFLCYKILEEHAWSLRDSSILTLTKFHAG